MRDLPRDPALHARVLAGLTHNEDAAIVRVPAGKALVQTLDFFTPIVNDPYRFGQIAAANSLSDVYAMGGEPWTAMNIVCFPIKTLSACILGEILRGGLDKVQEAGAALVGGHSVDDEEMKFGLSVTGLVDPERYATNAGLAPGDVLLLTKPLGTGILATAVKAGWENAPAHEEVLYRWCARLNSGPGRVIRELGLRAATDVTGFGLGGHLMEMAVASNVAVTLDVADLPVLEGAQQLAAMGLVPAGSHANRRHCADKVCIDSGIDPVLVDITFDAQTSGGMVLAVPPKLVGEAMTLLADCGDSAWQIGRVYELDQPGIHLHLR